MILLTTRRNRSSSIAETYPIGKVRPDETGLTTEPLRLVRSSDPLVGGLHQEGTDQVIDAGRTHDDGSRTSLRAVTIDSVPGTRGSSRGSTRALQFG